MHLGVLLLVQADGIGREREGKGVFVLLVKRLVEFEVAVE